MKRSIDSVDGLDDKGQEAKIPNQQPESDMASSYRDEGQHAENAQVSQTALATSFAQQESVLTAEQIETLTGFDKEGVRIVLEKIINDAYDERHHPEALNAISFKLAEFNEEELKVIFHNLPDILYKIAYVAYIDFPAALNAISSEVIKFDKDELKEIFQSSQNTLTFIAYAACEGYPETLNGISAALGSINKDDLYEIFRKPLDDSHVAYPLEGIAEAAIKGYPAALNAISGALSSLNKNELKTIFLEETKALGQIALAACKGYPDALNAISEQLANFSNDVLKEILEDSADTLTDIAHAACAGHPDALNALLTPLDGITRSLSRGEYEYLTCLNDFMKSHLTSLKTKSRFLGFERAFCNLDETTFSRITAGMPSKIISPIEKSINWYKEVTAILNQNPSDQAGAYEAEFQMQENLSARVRRFINDNVLQRDMDQTSRDSRIDFVAGLCAYLTMMGHHHLVLNLNKIYLTYQSGLNGCNTPGYADSVLDELSRTLAQPSGTSSVLHEFSRTLAQPSVTSFFQASPASPESDAERDKRYEKAYDMLKSFNANLGLWIQFDRGRDPLSAQKTVVEHFKVFLRAYLNALGNRNINNDIDYDDVNKVLKEKDWDAFVDCRDRFFVNELADTATSSGSFQPSSLGS